MYKLIRYQIKWVIINPKFYISILAGVLGYAFDAIKLVKFSMYLDEPLNIFEAYIYSSSNHVTTTIAFLAFVFFISDVPYNISDDTFTLLRLPKKQWINSKIIFVMLCSVIYYVILILLSMCLIAPFSYIGDIWSTPFGVMSYTNPMLSHDLFNVSFYAPHVIYSNSPIQAFSLSLLLNIIYSCDIALIMMLFNIIIRKNTGIISAYLLHAFGYLPLLVISYEKPFSLFAHSLLAEHSFHNLYDLAEMATVFESIIIFVVIGLIITGLLNYTSKTKFIMDRYNT